MRSCGRRSRAQPGGGGGGAGSREVIEDVKQGAKRRERKEKGWERSEEGIRKGGAEANGSHAEQVAEGEGRVGAGIG